jgi:GNAT superfamily N-acetyltransferase
VQHLIRQFSLEAGSLEVEYMEQYFAEFASPKTASELRQRLGLRDHLILISLAPSPEDESHWIPVAFKVGHELHAPDREARQAEDPAIADLSRRLRDCVQFEGRRIFYSWLGGTRREWRQQGHYRALTEQQEEWALAHGYQQMVVKTKNRFYGMRAALDRLQFDVLRFEPDSADNANSKVYLGKDLSPDLLRGHLTSRQVSLAA